MLRRCLPTFSTPQPLPFPCSFFPIKHQSECINMTKISHECQDQNPGIFLLFLNSLISGDKWDNFLVTFFSTFFNVFSLLPCYFACLFDNLSSLMSLANVCHLLSVQVGIIFSILTRVPACDHQKWFIALIYFLTAQLRSPYPHGFDIKPRFVRFDSLLRCLREILLDFLSMMGTNIVESGKKIN